ncbi:MAG: hypothetical protein HY526_04590 [Betaproteobacteria bacterium]|nr:hypothetical protein [Betaproteobacteria bacterium]
MTGPQEASVAKHGSIRRVNDGKTSCTIVWATAELASYFAVASDQYAWDAGAALQLLVSLYPLAAYVGAPIALLVIVFWSVLAFLKAPCSSAGEEHGKC